MGISFIDLIIFLYSGISYVDTWALRGLILALGAKGQGSQRPHRLLLFLPVTILGATHWWSSLPDSNHDQVLQGN